MSDMSRSLRRHNKRLLGEEVKSKEHWSLNILLSTELLGRLERRSTSDIDVRGAELAEETYCDEI